MPTYEYKCRKCGKTQPKFNTISQRNTGAPFCCDLITKKIITASTMGLKPMGASEFQAYPCPHSGELITSNKSRAEVMKKYDLREAELLT